MKKLMTLLISMAVVALLSCLAQATVYDVGPGRTYTNLVDVPWESLAAGDSVEIYYRATAYKEKFGVFTAGTANSPITIRGIAGPNGELPVIDGHEADSRSVAYLDYWSETRQVIKVGGSSTPASGPDDPPMYIIIENLEVKRGRDPYTFTDKNGNGQTYTTGASSIRVECGEYVTIRNCVLHDSANVFLTSGSSKEILFEGNYVYDGGYTIAEHNIYTEAHGITFQYNHLGPLRTSGSSMGQNLKDRSARTVVRYNWIEGGYRQIAMVESYDFSTIREYDGYGVEDVVYGNVLYEIENDDGSEIILYGGDMGAAYEQYYRSGPLQVYNNTIVSKRTDNTRFIRLKTEDQSADLYNNIFYVPSGTAYILSSSIGTCSTSHNWFQSGYYLTGATEDGTNISGSAPGFADYNNEDFSLANGSDCIDAAMDLDDRVLPKYDVIYHYVKHQDYESRPSDATLDIGAFEYGSTATLTVSTDSLPRAYKDQAYTATVKAYGGVKPYSWSIVSGSLPSGLSLDDENGGITGTPTALGTSNFTVRLTDSAATPSTDDQALSIVVSDEPSYFATAADTETGTSSTSYVNKATLTFEPATQDDWVVFGFAEFKYMSTNSSGKVRLTIDGNTQAEAVMEPTTNNAYMTFSTAGPINLSAASHTVNLDYCSGNKSATNYIRRARIVAIKKASLEMAWQVAESESTLTSTMTDQVSANFTPGSTGDYLLIWSAELYGNTTSYSTQVQAKLGGNVLDAGSVESKDTTDWWPFTSFAVAECGASQQTIAIAAARSGGTATHKIRRARVTAIRLSGGRLSGFDSVASDGESTTTSTSYVEKTSASWSVSASSDWLILSSLRLANSSTSYQTYAQVQLDNSTVLAEAVRRPMDATDWMAAGCIDVRTLASGTRQIDVDYKSSSGTQTAKIKYAHVVALPLE